MSYLISVYAARHEQPVMQSIISKIRSLDVKIKIDNVSILNSSVPASSPELAFSSNKDVVLEEYERREAQLSAEDRRSISNRHRMTNMLNDLNGAMTHGDFIY